MNKSLKPCPYCGTSNTVSEKLWLACRDELWHVYAVCCDISGPYRETTEEAVKAWNTRFMDKDL